MTTKLNDGRCRRHGVRLRRVMAAAAAGLLAVMLVACGDDDDNPPLIDAQGGTVTAADGAKVEVPAGALSQPVEIDIAARANGAPPLPAGETLVGAIHALTPHGTTFAVPVTVTVPFDPAQVPAGAAVGLMKTNADRSGWEAVAGATVSGNTVSAQVDSFSWVGVFLVPSLPTITAQPTNLTVTEGQDATFSAVAQSNGAPLLVYQWQRDGADIPGAVGASYTLAGAGLADSGARFAVVVGNGIGTVRSADAMLTVNAPSVPTVSALAPANQTVQVGGMGSMTVRLSATQPTATTVTLSATPGGVVSLPATVQVPASQLTAAISVTGVTPGQTQVTASIGTSSASAGVTVVASGPAPLNLAGHWSNEFRCSGGDTGTEIILVSQAGSDLTLISGGFAATGTISGEVMTYSGTGPGYTERGNWRRAGSDDLFDKSSSYTNTGGIAGSGSCSGTLSRLPPSVATTVAAGGNHTLAIRDDGTLWAWGFNTSGQLGIGTPGVDRVLLPTQVGTARNWTRVSAATQHTVALRADGSLWAWGWNTSGQLGDGTTSSTLSPVRIGTANDWSAIAAGSFHTVALRRNGTLWAWGSNGLGQLGDGTVGQRLVPTQVGTASDWVAIAAGREHTLAVKSDGSLWAWGGNANGQLGDGTTINRTEPTRVGTASNWKGVAAGIRYSLAVGTDGTLWAWGQNNSGQLGDGTANTRFVPTQVGTSTDWAAVMAGAFDTSLALKSDGTLWGWGNNGLGQLGNGTTANASAPAQIGTANDWIAAAVGAQHVVGIRADGSLWAWGYNLNGEQGDGTREQRMSPARMPGLRAQ